MIFINNKYTAWYNSIIQKASQRCLPGYTERHHIIPKSLGGGESIDNLVKLSAREDFICHMLLTKMTTGHEKIKMLHALGKFVQCNHLQQRVLTSRQYDIARKAIIKARIGSKHTLETRQKISNKSKGKIPWNKGLTGIKHSEESNTKRSRTLKGKSLSEKVGEERAKEIRLRISTSKIGKPSGTKGRIHPRKGTHGLWKMSEEGKKNVSIARKGIQFSEEHIINLTEANKINGLKRRGIPQKTTICPHCGKTGSVNGLTRYHFTNCKDKTH